MLSRQKLWLTPWLYRLLAGSIRLVGGGTRRRPDEHAVIFACLHRDMIPAIMHVRPAHPTLLVSHSPDGEILIHTLSPLGYRFVRGSTGNKGGGAFRGLLAALQNGSSIGIAVDGPRGPFGTVHDGVIHLSRLTGAPIVPLEIRVDHKRTLGTWDQTVLPLPFARITVREGPEIVVPSDLDDDGTATCADRLARALLESGSD
jgi:lysophospholipid acyltransferase (LPLAT)-like uncharacterized protein